MKTIIKFAFTTVLILSSSSVMAKNDAVSQISMSEVNAAYVQPFYILKGVVKNTSTVPMKNVEISFDVYELGRKVDTITTKVAQIAPGERARWQSPTTKEFDKYLVTAATYE